MSSSKVCREPTISSSVGRCLIRWATGPVGDSRMQSNKTCWKAISLPEYIISLERVKRVISNLDVTSDELHFLSLTQLSPIINTAALRLT